MGTESESYDSPLVGIERKKNVAFSVERSQLDLYFSQRPDFAMEMEACLATWDEMLETIYRTQGFDKESDAANPQPMFPNRFVFDVQLRKTNRGVPITNRG